MSKLEFYENAALLIIDVQNDFCDGGIMAIKGSHNLIPIINQIKDKFKISIFTKDWHPYDHISFKQNGGKHKLHCIKNTYGSELHSSLKYNEKKDYLIYKGMNELEETTSSFYVGRNTNGDKKSELCDILEKYQIKQLYLVGLGIDHCIFDTMIDAKIHDYECILIKNVIAGTEKKMDKILSFAKKFNIKIINYEDLS